MCAFGPSRDQYNLESTNYFEWCICILYADFGFTYIQPKPHVDWIRSRQDTQNATIIPNFLRSSAQACKNEFQTHTLAHQLEILKICLPKISIGRKNVIKIHAMHDHALRM